MIERNGIDALFDFGEQGRSILDFVQGDRVRHKVEKELVMGQNRSSLTQPLVAPVSETGQGASLLLEWFAQRAWLGFDKGAHSALNAQ